MDWDLLDKKKLQLDAKRPFPPALVRNLDEWFRVELTYTSNAIEGNTLSRRETAVVIEKGLTVGGKSLIEHLEATNHAKALDYIHQFVNQNPQSLTERDLLKIHEIILAGVDDENAGTYRNVAVRISGSTVVMPNPMKIPELMKKYIKWLQTTRDFHPAALASEVHYKLVTIHPFVDGNGRTARLLMNLILMMHGYPPAIIRLSDRLKYLDSLESAQLGSSKEPYEKIIFNAVSRSLDLYLKAISGSEEDGVNDETLPNLKIGQLAKATGESVPTIRFWTKEGLLEVAEISASGYQHFNPSMIERCRQIQKMKQKRMTLAEIKKIILDGNGE
jgi:Fic family protein